MSQHSVQRRRMAALTLSGVLVGGLLASLEATTAAAAAPGNDQERTRSDPMTGYSADSAAQQRAWEQQLQRLVDPDSAAEMSEEMSEEMSSQPGLVGTEGLTQRLRYSMRKLGEWGLQPLFRPRG